MAERSLAADAVLFDSDGVLLDSHELVEAGWRRLADELALGDAVVASAVAGMRPVDVLTGWLGPAAAEEAVLRLEEIELELAPAVVALPGALELVSRLPAGRWTIVTSASRELATARWQAAGVPVPTVTVTADDVTAGKPDPEPYREAARLLGVSPERCVVFEDSAAGGAAARAAGATAVAVGDQAWEVEPVIRIEDLTGAPAITLSR